MTSPVKALEFDPPTDTTAFSKVLTSCLEVFPRKELETLMTSVWPQDVTFQKGSTQKSPPVPLWVEGPVMAHLRSVKRCAERRIKLGSITVWGDYFDLLLDSVSTSRMSSWIQLHESEFADGDPRSLICLLIVHFHNVTQVTGAYHIITGWGVRTDLPTYIEEFNAQVNLIPLTVLSAAGRAMEFTRHIPTTVRSRLSLDRKVEEGASLLQLQQELRRHLLDTSRPTPQTRHGGGDTSQHSTTTSVQPAPAPAHAPVSGDVNMSALILALTAAITAHKPPPPAKPAMPRPAPGSTGQVCRVFAHTGRCKFGDTCIHMHNNRH